MKDIFPGHFRPTVQEFDRLWAEAKFVVDANVLLNLYRYSRKAREELEKALNQVSDQLYIPHQAAKEFLRNRLSVTAGQSKEYTSAISTINELIKKISSKDRHPFIADDTLAEFSELAKSLISNLEEQREELLKKLTEDEILEFVRASFEGRTGAPFSDERNAEIVDIGEKRYEAKVPPGYKDSEKDSADDPLRKYGDLAVWFQVIEHAKRTRSPVVFITDDKKEDWWLEQAGKTIGPRPELIEEFNKETGFGFWMYSVSKFVEETARRNQQVVSHEVIEEYRNIRELLKSLARDDERFHRSEVSKSIVVSQHPEVFTQYESHGLITVSLSHDMHYATGSGKFSPELSCVPELTVELVAAPDGSDEIGISFGCGTTRDFNVHLKARRGGLLRAGEYIFTYTANCARDDGLLGPSL